MKLRNKKTGEVIEADYISVATSGFDLADKDGNIIAKDIHTLPSCYSSVRELTSEFEDYKPTEPLIKDEKIRKAVRAWADADGADEKIYLTIDENGSRFANKYGGYIEFAFQIDMKERLYTITELCGEEEE